MDRETLARRSLALDSVYCTIAGATAFLTRRRVGHVLHVDPAAVAVAGIATVAWSALVGVLSRRDDWRSGTSLVGLANTMASAALLGAAVKKAKGPGRVVLAATGLEVAAFAASQAAALRDTR